MDKLNECYNDLDSSKIEGSIWNYTCKKADMNNIPQDWDNRFFKRFYMNKMISIYYNLINNGDDIYSRIQSGELNIEDIADSSPQELNPANWKLLLERKSANDEFLYLKKPVFETNQYKCRRCKERKCTYYELQTRSSDEPMTIFITCLNCGNKWKTS